MHKKIKFQGRVYMLESEFDEKIKEKLEEKIDTAIDEVLDGEGGSTEPSTPVDPAGNNVSLEETVEADPNEEKINQGISSLEASLGITLDETDKMILQSTLSDVLERSAGATAPLAPSVVPSEPMAEAPDMVLHEGRVYRKVGPVSAAMLESASKPAPKKIRVGGKVFALAESQSLPRKK